MAFKNIGPTEPIKLSCKSAKQSFSYLDFHSSAIIIHRIISWLEMAKTTNAPWRHTELRTRKFQPEIF